MTRSFKVAIPIKPHLKRYIQDFYHLPYELNQKDDLGLFLYHLLRRRKFRDRKYFSIDQCTERMEITVSNFYAFNQGCLLVHDYQIHLFNNYLEDMMIRHCITWIRGAEMAGMTNKAAIYKWIDMYDLDSGSQDWYHRIKKKYFRYRNWKKSNITVCPLSPNF